MAQRSDKHESARETLLRLGDAASPPVDPPSVKDVLENADATFEKMSERIERQKASLDRATATLVSAMDLCTCGGVGAAIEAAKVVADAEGE